MSYPPNFPDIEKRLGEPLWYTRHYLPRYDPFGPDLYPLHTEWAMLFEVCCPECGKTFKIGSTISISQLTAVHKFTPEDIQGAAQNPRKAAAILYGLDPVPLHFAPGKDEDDGYCHTVADAIQGDVIFLRHREGDEWIDYTQKWARKEVVE